MTTVLPLSDLLPLVLLLLVFLVMARLAAGRVAQ